MKRTDLAIDAHMSKTVSFCVVSVGSAEDLERCLRGIRAQGVPATEVLVGGRHAQSVPGTIAGGEADLDAGRVNRLRNRLCAAAKGEWIVLIDSAVALEPDWTAQSLGLDCCDVVAGRLACPDGARAIDWSYRPAVGRGWATLPARYDEWSPKVFCSLWLVAIRRRVWQSVAFDEALPAGSGEGAAFCREAYRTGWRLGVSLPPAGVFHRQAGPLDPRPLTTYQEYQQRSERAQAILAEARQAATSRRYAQAEEGFRRAAELLSDDPAPWAELARIHRVANRLEACEQAVAKALALVADDPASLCQRGWLHWRRQRYAEALADFQAVARDDADGAVRREGLRGEAWSHLALGQAQSARADFSSLLEQADADPALALNAQLGLAWSCLADGDRAEARRIAREALSRARRVDAEQKRLLRRLLTDARHGPVGRGVRAPDEYVHRAVSSRLRRLAGRVKRRILRALG